MCESANKTQMCIAAYEKHKHLHSAAKSVGIPWQTVYWHLRQAGVPVVGDKSRYGSSSDRLAARAEARFQEIAPCAIDMNRKKFQSKVDFTVGGLGVDIKCGRLLRDRWAFCIKKQEAVADFFVCFAMSNTDHAKDAVFLHTLLIPGEIARRYKTMSLSNNVRGKWWQYEISDHDLGVFFNDQVNSLASA